MKLHVMIASAWAALTCGQAVKASSLPVTMASDQPAQKIKKDGDYEKVAASASDQALGATGATGDYLDKLIIIPATVNAGAVSIKDGGGSAITIFPGGTASLTELRPMTVSVEAVSTGGAWKVTTGADVSVLAVGKFT